MPCNIYICRRNILFFATLACFFKNRKCKQGIWTVRTRRPPPTLCVGYIRTRKHSVIVHTIVDLFWLGLPSSSIVKAKNCTRIGEIPLRPKLGTGLDHTTVIRMNHSLRLVLNQNLHGFACVFAHKNTKCTCTYNSHPFIVTDAGTFISDHSLQWYLVRSVYCHPHAAAASISR